MRVLFHVIFHRFCHSLNSLIIYTYHQELDQYFLPIFANHKQYAQIFYMVYFYIDHIQYLNVFFYNKYQIFLILHNHND